MNKLKPKPLHRVRTLPVRMLGSLLLQRVAELVKRVRGKK
jgi:hypothetical protein